MPIPAYPKKSVFSYLIPFALIILLLGAGFVVVSKNIQLTDIVKLFSPPDLKKDEKVTIVYFDGVVQHTPWNEENPLPLTKATTLSAGDSITTGEDSLLVLRFFEESEVRLDQDSEVKLIRLDKDQTLGNHLALKLISGRLWRRGMNGNRPDADFVIEIPSLSLRMTGAAVVDSSTSPSIARIVGGSAFAYVNLLKTFELTGGEELTAGKDPVVQPIAEEYLNSEWYLWNIEKEKQLGEIVAISPVKETRPEEKPTEKIADDEVIVDNPKDRQVLSAQVLVSGTYQQESIEHIYVNGQEAVLGLSNTWELTLKGLESVKELVITAVRKGSTDKKLVKVIPITVDSKGPLIGKILQPEVDLNGNGVLAGDTLQLKAEVTPDTAKVCISHNDTDPFCLKQFKKGDKTFTYLGAVKYGNVEKGKNKYTIKAYDELDNETTKIIYLFKDIPKPDTKLEETTPPVTEGTTSSDLSRPVIVSPDPSIPLETKDQDIKITGTVDKRSVSLLLNGRKANYTSGSSDFEVLYPLEPGENVIKIQSVDAKGNKSKSALITVLML